jgi:hypothetical protein
MIHQENNLLINLHRWAKGQDENFTTEAFVHVLKHLILYEPRIGNNLLKKITSGMLDLKVKDLQKVKVRTQPTVKKARPDFEIRYPDYLIFGEVKVDTKEDLKQLNKYLSILQSFKKINNKLLVFLTRYPADYPNHQIKTLPLRWFQIAKWLEDETKRKKIKDTSIHVVEQFLGFLDERNIIIKPVESEISRCIQLLQSKVFEPPIPQRIRNLEILANYPDLEPLHNVLMMMGEVLTTIDFYPKPKLDSGQHNGGWIGYTMENLRFGFSIYYRDPDVINFDTYRFKPDKTKFENKRKKIGRVFIDYRKKLRYENVLDIVSSGFLLKSKNKQIQILEKFLKESYEFVKSIELKK